jgi:hypothetical protein
MFYFLAIVALLAIAALSFGAVYTLRQGFKFLLREFWQRGSVRRSVDVAIAGFFCLIGASLLLAPMASKILYEKAQAIPVDGTKAFVLAETLKYIAILEFLGFFAGHFFQFVLLPAFLVGFACYIFERHKEQKQKEQLTKIASSVGLSDDVMSQEANREIISDN